MTNDGIHPNARNLIETMLETAMPLQVVHYSRGLRSACGEWGQMSKSKDQVTCPHCKGKRGR
jgi:hypothetical protein